MAELVLIDQSHRMVDAGGHSMCSECYGCTCHNYQNVLAIVCSPVPVTRHKEK